MTLRRIAPPSSSPIACPPSLTPIPSSCSSTGGSSKSGRTTNSGRAPMASTQRCGRRSKLERRKKEQRARLTARYRPEWIDAQHKNLPVAIDGRLQVTAAVGDGCVAVVCTGTRQQSFAAARRGTRPLRRIAAHAMRGLFMIVTSAEPSVREVVDWPGAAVEAPHCNHALGSHRWAQRVRFCATVAGTRALPDWLCSVVKFPVFCTPRAPI